MASHLLLTPSEQTLVQGWATTIFHKGHIYQLLGIVDNLTYFTVQAVA